MKELNDEYSRILNYQQGNDGIKIPKLKKLKELIRELVQTLTMLKNIPYTNLIYSLLHHEFVNHNINHLFSFIGLIFDINEGNEDLIKPDPDIVQICAEIFSLELLETNTRILAAFIEIFMHVLNGNSILAPISVNTLKESLNSKDDGTVVTITDEKNRASTFEYEVGEDEMTFLEFLCIRTLILNSLASGANAIKVKKEGDFWVVLDNSSDFPDSLSGDIKTFFTKGLNSGIKEEFDLSSGAAKMVAYLAGQSAKLEQTDRTIQAAEELFICVNNTRESGFKGIKFRIAPLINWIRSNNT